jgi:hypothetical protein
VGHEFVFTFDSGGMEVIAVDPSTVMFITASMDFPCEFEGEIGIDTTQLKKLIPKGIDEIMFKFGKTINMSSEGYESTMASYNETSCLRRPKHEFPVPKEGVPINPQNLYDKVKELRESFDGQCFSIDANPSSPSVITLRDIDVSIGTMKTTVPALVNVQAHAVYPYDFVADALNSIRLITDNIVLKFMPLPGNDRAVALCICGKSEGNLPITFQYIIAPRLEDK